MKGHDLTSLPAYHFTAIGCRHTVLTTRPETLARAGRLAEAVVADLDRAASRFRSDSEVCRIAQLSPLPGETTVTAEISDLLADCLAAALEAARLTDGLVDPTLGRAMVAAGYDADLDRVRARPAGTPQMAGADTSSREARPVRIVTIPRQRPGRPTPTDLPPDLVTDLPTDTGVDVGDPWLETSKPVDPQPVPSSWRDVHLEVDPSDGQARVTLPAHTLLDLGATAKAHAADLIAQELAAFSPGGFVVNLGGDLAVSGDAPAGGWDVAVDADTRGSHHPLQVVAVTGGGIATSSTRLRTWQHEGRTRHHVLDPRTGQAPEPAWAQVTCAGRTCLEANAASTAAVVLGAQAPAWLEEHGVAARLDHLDGSVTLTRGWPRNAIRAA